MKSSPTSLGITRRIDAGRRRRGEGFPDMSRFALLFTEQEASCYLPDKEFRYLRTVIVTAAVYRGLVSELRRPKTANPST